MNGRAPQLAAGLTRGWVRIYTRGLPPDVRASRRDELESDLWEHRQSALLEARPPGATSLEIVGRLVAGIPADLSWRHEHRLLGRRASTHSRSRDMVTSVKKHGMTAVAVAFGLWLLAVAVLAAFDDGLSSTGRVAWPLVSVACGIVVLVALIAMHRGRRGARGLLALGAIAGGLFSMWAIVPAIAAGLILVWLYAPRRVGRTPAQPA